MLTIVLEATEDQPQAAINLEHSLVSLSKWESELHKPFHSQDAMDEADTRVYVRCMLLGDPPEGDWLRRLTPTHFVTINGYMGDRMSATWFREAPNAPKPREVITNELIYYWMIQFGIPFEPCERWHFSRLMTLIRIAGIKQTKPKKMTRAQQAEEYSRLNAERRAKLGTTG